MVMVVFLFPKTKWDFFYCFIFLNNVSVWSLPPGIRSFEASLILMELR